jgi:hypothetical protein
MSRPKIFISYNHKDESFKDELVTHLNILQEAAGLIEVWDDQRIGAGAAWEAEIDAAMAEAAVAIFLISANFLTSSFILKKEVPTLLERRREAGMVVVPVLAKECAWETVPWLAAMQMRPRGAKPVWREGGRYADEELAAIVKEIAGLIQRATPKPPPPASLTPPAMPSVPVEELVKFLAPFLPTLQRTSGHIANSDAASGLAQQVWQALQPPAQIKPSLQEALHDVAKQPNDADAQATLRRQLKKLLSDDAALAAALERVWHAAKPFVTNLTNVTASNRGVAIGGDVQGGTIITGNQTTQQGKYNINIQHAEGLAIGDGARVAMGKRSKPRPSSETLPRAPVTPSQSTMVYHDFHLRCRDWANGQFKVEVTNSPKDRMRAAEATTINLSELRPYLAEIARGRIARPRLIALGEALARALFTPTVREMFFGSLDLIGAEQGLRLRLILDAPQLADVPWEYLYAPRVSGDKGHTGFLALDTRVSIVRHEAITTPVPSVRATLPLKLVAGLAAPNDQDKLDLARERQLIEKALANVAQIRPTFLEHLTVEQLEDAGTGTHLFHFAGHGAFKDDEGYVLLENARQKTHWFAGEKLALTLRRLGVRVAVLGACQTAQRSALQAWNSVASSLMKVGVAACVAMQYPIFDENAIAFQRSFYRELAAGKSLDEAVGAGRLSILNQCDADNADWGVPVLYMRSADGVIFPEVRQS